MSDAQPTAATSALRVLAESAAALARGASLDASLERLLHAALAATGADLGAIMVQDPDGVTAEVVTSTGVEGSTPEAVAAACGAADLVAEAGAGPSRFDVPRARPDGSAGLVSMIPLVAGHDGIDRVVGLLVVGRTGHPLDGLGHTILSALADLAAVEIDRAQVRSAAIERAEWFERIASSDPLTGLANRHVLDRILELELTRAGRHGTEVSIAVFDVDGFQALNERSGREVGDRVLREVATAISSSVRIVDSVARLGGDEFVVVAPGSAGVAVARRVMETIEGLAAVVGHEVSVSAGVARFPANGATVEELLEAASGALRGLTGRSGVLAEASTTPTT